ncbi:MAG: hypothetical protein JW774_11625 [Candidatus Aureabacteria bacterium]|nr:hypothetical protein [Candidatus Auribacterota bacterium]
MKHAFFFDRFQAKSSEWSKRFGPSREEIIETAHRILDGIQARPGIHLDDA